MKESVLQYVWQHKLFVQHGLTTTTGQQVKIIDVGRLNADSGPDFFNAKVQLDYTLWAGNIEIHVNSSDWYRHHHDDDDRYNSVILHVVLRADQEIIVAGHRQLPQLELKFPEQIERRFEELTFSSRWLPCIDHLEKVPPLVWLSWKNALIYERLTTKVSEIRDQLVAKRFDFDEVFFSVIARSFGFSINGAAFEAMAKSVSWLVVLKNRNSLLQLEALLMGQSGLLFKAQRNFPADEYLHALATEYRLQQHKYGLIPIPASLWRWLRLRPENFPEIRIAQLASLLYSNDHLFRDFVENPELEYWMQILSQSEVSEYWKYHVLAGVPTSKQLIRPGTASLTGLIINAVVPMSFCYAEYLANFAMKEKLVTILERLPVENNVIVRNWKKAGVDAVSASDSQALIQLYKKYCETKNCLRCRIGHTVMTAG